MRERWMDILIRNCSKEEIIDFFMQNQYRMFCMINDLEYETESFVLDKQGEKLVFNITKILNVDLVNAKSMDEKFKLHEKVGKLMDQQFKIDDKKEKLKLARKQRST